MQSQKKIGLIAGNGDFPIEFAISAKQQGYSVIACAHISETKPELEKFVDQLVWVRVGQLGKIINEFKKYQINTLAFLGGIKRPNLFTFLRLDRRARKLVKGLSSYSDDKILRALAGELEQEGFNVISANEILKEYLVKAGQLSKRALTKEEILSAKIAWKAAEAIGNLDIGQTAIAYQGLVVALEAVEGTDACIARAKTLCKINVPIKEDGAVLVKLCKSGQDRRLDLPAIGPDTIENLVNSGITAVVLKADAALILKPEETLKLINRNEIALECW